MLMRGEYNDERLGASRPGLRTPILHAFKQMLLSFLKKIMIKAFLSKK
jgi:hypothetical protein